MTLNTELPTDFINFVEQYGDYIRLQVYTQSYSGGEYDDKNYLTKSGTDLWTRGIVQPVRGKFGSDEAKLMEAGKLVHDDSRIYLPGSYRDSLTVFTKIGIGSPTPVEYSLLEEGRATWKAGSNPVYEKVYGRVLNNGSFQYQV